MLTLSWLQVPVLSAALITQDPTEVDGRVRAFHHPRLALEASTAVADEASRAPEIDSPAVRPALNPAPRLSLLARDGARSYSLVRGRILTLDEVRPNGPITMVLSRVALARPWGDAFVEVGGGQWRVDGALLPSRAGSTWLVSRVGVGLELKKTSRSAALAGGLELTIPHDPLAWTLGVTVSAVVWGGARF